MLDEERRDALVADARELLASARSAEVLPQASAAAAPGEPVVTDAGRATHYAKMDANNAAVAATGDLFGEPAAATDTATKVPAEPESKITLASGEGVQ